MSQRARLIVKKSDYQGWAAEKPSACMAAHGRASHQAERCGEGAHARAHLQGLRALLDLAAAGTGRSRSGDHRHRVHDDAAAHVLLLELQEELKTRLPAPRHAPRAHMRR